MSFGLEVMVRWVLSHIGDLIAVSLVKPLLESEQGITVLFLDVQDKGYYENDEHF